MSLVSCQDLSFAHGSEPLFDGLVLSVDPSDRVGLVGANGCGKSTLLAILAGIVTPDSGKVVRRRDVAIEHVPQFVPEALKARTIADVVGENARSEEGRSQVPRILDELGFEPAGWDRTVDVLSGGWKNRLLLARALAGEPDLLLLDEPTNHMDLQGLLFFEHFLNTSVRCAVVLVSHDRTLLDACTSRTVFLRDKRACSLRGGYSPAKALLLEQDEAAMLARKAEEQEITRLRASAKRLAHWGKVFDNESFATRAKSMEKRIGRLEADRTFVTQETRRSIGVETQETRAAMALRCENVTIERPGGGPLFTIDGFYVKKGERIALLGKNGCGKTVFLEALVAAYGAGPDQQPAGAKGTMNPAFKLNPQYELGYYDQYLRHLDPGASIHKVVAQASNLSDLGVTRELIRVGFRLPEHQQRVRDLSGGERARLQFLLLKIRRPSFLVLDEPTNHLDIDGCEELEAQILDSEATVLFTSHDRRFAANVASRYCLIEGGRLRDVPSPEGYYASEQAPPRRERTRGTRTAPDLDTGARAPEAATGEAMLARILVLEEKLRADRRQKTERQNRRRQAEWEVEIASLYANLERDPNGGRPSP